MARKKISMNKWIFYPVVIVPVAVIVIIYCVCCYCPVTTVFVLRHAERVDSSPDSELSEAGLQRAQKLVHVAGEAGISAIFATEYRRTQQTAQPLADELGLTVNTDFGMSDVEALVNHVLSEYSGETVLLVGHSIQYRPLFGNSAGRLIIRLVA